MSMAAVLLYTAPAWLAVIRAIFLSEPLPKRKTLAVVLEMIGRALVARVYDLHELQLNWLGILAGPGAELDSALYSVFNKTGLRYHSGWTVLAYGLLFGILFLTPLQSPQLIIDALHEPGIASPLAFAVLGERLDPGQLFGGALILVAVISLTQSSST